MGTACSNCAAAAARTAPTPSGNCSIQPWQHGCGPTAELVGLSDLSSAYRVRFERAKSRPWTAKYLVFSSGGGFGNQMSEVVSLMLAALLTDRILVNCPNLSQWTGVAHSATPLNFDMRKYFTSSAFPYHGSPTILNAISHAERGGRGAMSYASLPCPSCPPVALEERSLLSALGSWRGAQVLRVRDFELGKGARYTLKPQTKVRTMLKLANELRLRPALRLPRHAMQSLHASLWQLLLKPTPAVMRQLSSYTFPSTGHALGVHVRSGDAEMLSKQMANPKLSSSWGQTRKCAIDVRNPRQVDALFQCVERMAAGGTIFLATDFSPLVQQAAKRFGSQMLPPTPGEPRHTFRPMDKIHPMVPFDHNSIDDPHMKQMLDFVLLASTPKLMLTCGSYGEGARTLSYVVREVLHYSSASSCRASNVTGTDSGENTTARVPSL